MRIKLLMIIGSAAWLFIISSEILAQQFDFLLPVAVFGKFILGNICHQSPQKLMSCGQASLLVCSRCAGIYVGGFFASLLLLCSLEFKSKKLFLVFIAASALMLLDVAGSTFGVYHYIKSLAFSTGLFFGIIVGIFIFAQLIKGKYEG